MAEIERFRIVDALFIIGSIITFIADQATGGLSKNIQISQNILKSPAPCPTSGGKLSEILLILIRARVGEDVSWSVKLDI